MNRIRVLVQVIVMVGILTGCDSCDDGMDYPIVEYAQGNVTFNAQVLERVRLALKAYPDIKFLELRPPSPDVIGRIGNRAILSVGLLTSLGANPTDATIQSMVHDLATDYLTQLFGAPAGPLVGTNSPSVGTNSPLVGTAGLSVGTNGPFVGTNGPLVGTNGPFVGTNSPLVGTNAGPWA
jgi:hypothetical protein